MTLLERALTPGALRVEFQPIVRIDDGTVVAYEGLTRGPYGTSLERADVLFEYMRRKRAEELIDRATTRIIIRAASELGKTQRISINVHAVTLIRDATYPGLLLGELEEAGLDPSCITVEVLEFSAPPRFDRLVTALAEIRSLGCRIAIDDVGAGTSNYRTIIECEPEWLKLDRWIIGRLREDRRSRLVVESLSRLAADLGAEVIAEGVETSGVCQLVSELGVRLAQGYFFGRPLTIKKMERGALHNPLRKSLAPRETRRVT